MINITCKHCNREVRVAMYFSDARICTTKDFVDNRADQYKAMVDGRALCPVCGKEIHEIFVQEIIEEDIVSLAVGEH